MTRLSPYASVTETRKVLDKYGLTSRKTLGQNFLVNDDVLRKTIDLADVDEEDVIIEVGPGIGTLTAALLQRARFVVAVEKDAALIPVLNDTLDPWRDRLALLEMNAIDLTWDDVTAACRAVDGLETPGKLVANLPYSVAATVVLDFFQRFDAIRSATVMVQREVADRMTAKPQSKSYGAYTVKLSLLAHAHGRFPVGAKNFFPVPHVGSAVLRLDRHAIDDASGMPASRELVAAASTMADAAFANRRKTIINSSKHFFAERMGTDSPLIDKLPRLFEDAHIDIGRRGETLTVQEYVRLGQAYLDSGFSGW